MGQSPRSFSREFKEAAVKRMLAGESPSQLSRALTIRRKLLYQWRDRYRRGGSELLRGIGRPPRGSMPIEQLRWGHRYQPWRRRKVSWRSWSGK